MITQDLERLDLAPYQRETVNITGFRMVDNTNPMVAEYLKRWTSTYGHGGRDRAHPLFVNKRSLCLLFILRINLFIVYVFSSPPMS